MNKDNAKYYLPLVQALSEGKKIEAKSFNGWYPCDELNWLCHHSSYRIKPESKLRPWKPNEVPVGALINLDDRKVINGMYIIVACDNIGIVYSNTAALPSLIKTEYKDIINNTYSLDQGKTWLPCGVIE